MSDFSHSTTCFVRPDVPVEVAPITGVTTLVLRFGNLSENVTIFVEPDQLARIATVIRDFLDADAAKEAAQ